MTLFGRTLDGQEIVALVSLLLMLVLWIIVWRDNRRETNWFKAWNEARKARKAGHPGRRPKSVNPAAPGADAYSRRSSFSVRIVPHQPALNSARMALGS